MTSFNEVIEGTASVQPENNQQRSNATLSAVRRDWKASSVKNRLLRKNMDARTQEIFDKQAIREVQNRYSYSIDCGQYDNLDVLFTPNAIYHFITGFTDDIKDLKKTIRDALQPLTSSQHINTNQWAEIEGDLAQAGCYFTVHMHKEGVAGGEHFEMGGRYDDELIRASDGWRFSKRAITILWSEGNRQVRWQD